MADMKQHIQWLNSYIDAKLREVDDPSPLELKRLHTFKVYENAEQIIASEKLADDLIRASQLAALYHDVARFDQYCIYGTFKDAQSFNHGLEGVRILKHSQRFLGEKAHIASLALAAIGLHNRRFVPVSLEKRTAIITAIVRDADKLDILRVLDEHLAKKPYSPTVVLGLPDDPDLSNPHVVEMTIRGECASYGELRSVNDFRVLLGAWFFSLNFPGSRKLFLNSPHAWNLVEALPQNQSYTKVRTFLLNRYTEEKQKLGIL